MTEHSSKTHWAGVGSQFSTSYESDTDYSDLDDDPMLEEAMINKMSATKKPLSREGQIEWEIENELSAVVRTANSSRISSPILHGFAKKEEVSAKWKKSSPSSSFRLGERQKGSPSSSEARYGINGTAMKLQPGPVQPRSHLPHEQLSKKYCSSQNVASSIHKVLGKRMSVEDIGKGMKLKEVSSSEPKSSSLTNGSKSMAKLGRGFAMRSESVKVRSRSESMDEHDHIPLLPCSELGGVAKTRAMFEKLSGHPLSAGDGCHPNSYARKDSCSSVTLSSEGTDTDMESSLDLLGMSRPDRAYPRMRNMPKSSPNFFDNNKMELPKTSKFLDDSIIDEHGEDGDELRDMHHFRRDMRSRTKTLSGMPVRGTSKVEIGRKKMKEHRRDSLKMKMATSMTAQKGLGAIEATRADRVTLKVELEHLSPLLAAKIKNMSLRRIYNQYGGKIVTTCAVAVIEEAWRSYRLRKHFLERLQEIRENHTVQRKRAHTLHRVPSIMGIRQHYRSVRMSGGKPMDPMVQSKNILVNKRWCQAYSGIHQEVVEKRHSKISLQSVEEEEVSERSKEVSVVLVTLCVVKIARPLEPSRKICIFCPLD